MWHLDTNIVIAYLNGNREIAEKIKAALPDLAVSSMVFGELLYGAKASRRHAEDLERLREFMQFWRLWISIKIARKHIAASGSISG